MSRSKAKAAALETPLRPRVPAPRRPSRIERGGELHDEVSWKEAYAKWPASVSMDLLAQMAEKLGPLLDHYKIARDPETLWPILALALAMDYVPGFQVDLSEPPVRKKKWTDKRHAELYCRVMQEKARRQAAGLPTSDMDVCRWLSKFAPCKAWGKEKVLFNEFVRSQATDLVKLIVNMNADPRLGARAYEIWLEGMAEK